MQVQSQALSYAALLLLDTHVPIEADNIEKLTAKAGIKLTKGLAAAFVKSSNGQLKSWISLGGGGGASTPAPVVAAKVVEAPKVVEKAPEPEEDMDMGGLFD